MADWLREWGLSMEGRLADRVGTDKGRQNERAGTDTGKTDWL